MRTGEWVVAAKGRLYSTTVVRGVAGELEDEKWRLGSGSFFSMSFSWRCARCFSPYQQPKCSRR